MKSLFFLMGRRVKAGVFLAGAVFLIVGSQLRTHAQLPAARNLDYAAGWKKGQAAPQQTSFSAWTDRYLANTGTATVAEGVALAQERRAWLVELIKTRPEKALAAAVPAAVRQQLPPQVAAEIETRVSGIGDLSVLIFCPSKDGGPVPPIQRTVLLNGQTYQAYVSGRRAAQGSKLGVPLHGIAVGGVLALHDGALRELEGDETVPSGKTVTELPDPGSSPSVAPAALAEMDGQFYRFTSRAHLLLVEAALEQAEAGVSPYPARSAATVLQSPNGTSSSNPNGSNPPNPPSAWTTGLKKILVIRVDFSDFTGDPTFPGGPAGTAATLQTLIDSQVSPFYARSSYGQTTLTNTVTTQLYRMPRTASSYATANDNTGLHTDAETLASANYTLANYDRIVVVFSFLGNLPGSFINYGGLAQITAPRVWINGEFDFRVVAHELGHTYGLFHAGLWQVTDGNPLSAGGTTIEYGDDFDTMGANFANSQNTDFSPYFKNILGWLADSQVRTIGANGVYRINTFDSGNFAAAAGDQTLALKLVRDSEHTYWVGIRRNFTSNAYQQNGAYVIWGLNTVGGGGGGGFQSQLLDLNTPGAAPSGGVNDDYDSALQFLQPLTDTSIGLLMTPLSEGGSAPNTYVDIQVGAGGSPDFRITTNSLVGGNGNGVIDPNECNSLFLVLTNVGLGGGTNVQGILTTTNAHVIVTGKSSFYPNLPAGAAGTNLVAFQFSTSPDFVCGTPVNFTLTMKADQFTQTNRFALASGIQGGTPVRFNSVGTAPIPDLSSGDLPLVVTNFNIAVLKATISLHILHTYDSDLRLQLISPGGITNLLAVSVGGSQHNFGGSCSDGARTVFDDDAPLSINSGSAPFIGSFRPVDPFSVFIGQTGTNVNGTWHLHVVDEVAIDSGTIECWSLLLSTPVCTDGGGECPGSDLAIGGSVAPEPLIIGGNLIYSFSITNQGPKAAKGVTFTQTLPPSSVFIGASVSQGSIAQSGGTVNGNLGNLAVGAVATLSVTVQPLLAGAVTSTAATAAVSDPDYDLSNNSVTLTSHINPPTADLAVSISAAPNPVLVGGTLTYSILVTNNGPSTASSVVVSNNLAASVAITSASPSQGTFTISGNTVIFNIGALSPGAIATAIITGIPSALGQVTATATVRASQLDPVSANNTASVNTSVSPSADLVVGFQSVPGSIVLGSTLNYTVNATNLGPSTASAVFLSQTLPPNAQVLASSSTPGTTLSQAGNIITCNVGGLAPGGVVTLNVSVLITNAGPATSTANVSGALTDVNPANNSATVTTVVALPFVSIQAASALLTAESFAPTNGAIEPGETVTVRLYLQNAGNVSTTNLMARLLATGGVTAPTTATLSYGVLAPGGLPSSNLFSFTAAGTNGGSIVATLQISGDISTNVSFTFQLPKVVTFANTNVIVIPDSGTASPYPAVITVSGVTGLVGKVTATLSNFNHTYPNDVSVLLVSPTGTRTLLMSHTADLGSPVAQASYTFDDSALTMLPQSGSAGSGSWLPSAYPPAPVFPGPAPAAPYSSVMSVFNNANPNGTWSLFVWDGAAGDRGGISNGWSLAFTTITPLNQTADLAVTSVSSTNQLKAGASLTNTFTVTNNGTNAANNVTFTSVLSTNVNVSLVSVSVSQGTFTITGGTVTANLTNLNVGASATVVEVMIPNASGSITNTANVSAIQIDLVPVNNTNVIITTVSNAVADVAIAITAPAGSVVVGSNVVYTIAVTNQGPDTAVNVVVTNPLPAGLSFVSANHGVFSGGKLTNNFGNLAAGAGASLNVTALAASAGTITNTATAATGSTDTNAANNAASVVTVLRLPAAQISAVSARLISENFSPADGTVDPGETVTVSLALANTGEIDTVHLVATLLNTGGVTPVTNTNNYGAVVRNGAAVAGNFTFTASSAASGSVTATLQLFDGAVNLGTAAFTFALPRTNSFVNTNAIIIPDHGIASPYPATITVAGLTGLVSKATVTLNGVTHAFPKDIGVLLVSPTGTKSVVMSGVGGGNSITNLTLTFDDAAAAALSASARIVSGTSRPTSYPASRTFLAPAPAGNATAVLSLLNGGDPNGVWSLYVVDDVTGDGGVINQGWSLALTTVSPLNPTADLAITASASPSQINVGGHVTYTLLVTNNGMATATGVFITNALPYGVALGTVTIAPGGTYTTNAGAVICSLNNLVAGAGAMVTINVIPNVAGLALDAASITGNEADLNPANNAASASVTVTAITQAHLSGVTRKPNGQFQFTLTGQPNLNYIVLATTNLTTGVWTSISTNPAVNGTFQFVDTNAPGLPARYYRTMVGP